MVELMYVLKLLFLQPRNCLALKTSCPKYVSLPTYVALGKFLLLLVVFVLTVLLEENIKFHGFFSFVGSDMNTIYCISNSDDFSFLVQTKLIMHFYGLAIFTF